jgi:uncharacterized protein (DUF952 family)
VTLIYKILTRAEWERALVEGRFEGSGLDRRDGFIHFSTAGQVAETARRHFRGQSDLVVLAVEAEGLGAALKWEPSRGGELFPHLRGPLACTAVIEVSAAPLSPDGTPRLDSLAP